MKIFCLSLTSVSAGPARTGRLWMIVLGKQRSSVRGEKDFQVERKIFLMDCMACIYFYFRMDFYTTRNWKSIENRISYKLQCQVDMSTQSDIGSDIISSQQGLVFRGIFLAIIEYREIFWSAKYSKALYKRLVAVNNWVAIVCFSPNKFSI